MDIVSGIVVYVIMWWLVLFAVLPWGVVTQHEAGQVEPGSEPGAPVKTGLWRKFLITTVITLVLWLAIDFAVVSGLFTAAKHDVLG